VESDLHPFFYLKREKDLTQSAQREEHRDRREEKAIPKRAA
jgi:hypothetical protein